MMDNLIKQAWLARDNAYLRNGDTKVGCAIQDTAGNIYLGWNIEGPWHTSIHAEVCAVTRLIGLGGKAVTIAIVADVKRFTPCGACLDWLMWFCGPDTKLEISNRQGITTTRLGDLYPLYPTR